MLCARRVHPRASNDNSKACLSREARNLSSCERIAVGRREERFLVAALLGMTGEWRIALDGLHCAKHRRRARHAVPLRNRRRIAEGCYAALGVRVSHSPLGFSRDKIDCTPDRADNQVASQTRSVSGAAFRSPLFILPRQTNPAIQFGTGVVGAQHAAPGDHAWR